MLNFIFSYRRSFLYGSLIGILLRLFFMIYFEKIDTDDTIFYADIAQTWLASGVYGTTEDGMPIPTYIRLPGYPAFLAAVFAIFGNNQYPPILLIQNVVDLGTCFLISAIALEMFSEGAAIIAFWAAILCPFTANYTAIALTETLSIFFTTLALWAAVKGTKIQRDRQEQTVKWWILCGMAIGIATYLRSDGIILLMAVIVFLIGKLIPLRRKKKSIFASFVTTFVVLAMLAPWMLRNWLVFHEFEPLAPRYANAPNEYVAKGFNQWIKTWIIDYASVEDIYWKVSSDRLGDVVDLNDLPYSAFYNNTERKQTLVLFKELNKTRLLTPKLDTQFADLAQTRIQQEPLRYYLYLPILRIADMWLRPRTEFLEMDKHWWKFELPIEDVFSIGYAIVNFMLLTVAVFGMWKFRLAPAAGLLITFVVIRSVFLGTMENPEPRYTLECFPIILIFNGAVWYRIWGRSKRINRLI